VITPSTSAIAGRNERSGTTQSGRFDGTAPTEGPVTVDAAVPFVDPVCTLAVGTPSSADAWTEPLRLTTEAWTVSSPTGTKTVCEVVRFTKYVAFENAFNATGAVPTGPAELWNDKDHPRPATRGSSTTVSATLSTVLPVFAR
jgi:hypothetical protein